MEGPPVEVVGQEQGTGKAPPSAVKDVAFGSTAGMIAKIFEHPFDLVKVRLQSQPPHLPARFTGPVDCFRQTIAKEGFLGLYRGISMPLVGAAAENATLFFAYRLAQDSIKRGTGAPANAELSLGQLGVAAGAAGAVASFVLTPIEYIKCRMQVQMLSFPTTSTSTSPSAPSKPPGAIPLLFSTLKTHGARGLWLGQTGTLIRETGGSAAWFGTFEAVTRFFLRQPPTSPLSSSPSSSHPGEKRTKSDLPTWQLLLAGACAGVAYNVVCFPADSVKSALQTSDELGGAEKKGFWATGREIWKGRGMRGLYAGMGVTIARSAPSSAIIFGLFEWMMGTWG